MRLRNVSRVVLGALVCLLGGAAQASANLVHVEARLLSVDRAPGCGVFAWSSPAVYLILRGPPDMVGKTVELLIPCVEMSRRGFSRDAGDLRSFKVGDEHDLELSGNSPSPFDYARWGKSPVIAGKKWYVAAASLHGAAVVADDVTVVRAARSQVGVTIHYDPSYARIAYPMGDVPLERGVCADVIVRAFRADGIDLQRRVHEDMAAHFALYPHTWGLRGPDTNIDHRRVPNLETFFRRLGDELAVTATAQDYQAGDIVSWRLPNGLAHIGLVSDRMAGDGSGRPLMIHNIGAGAQEEDVLFAWKVVGHFRWKFEHAGERARQ